jgi:diguanylate cyclase (GGDEF)-like protein
MASQVEAQTGRVAAGRTNANQKAPLSVIAARLVQEALKEDASITELAKMASGDAAFAMRVLSIANSAAYGPSRDVRDVRTACVLLGVRGLRNVALGIMVSDMVPAHPDATVLFANSLRRAVTASLLAEKVRGVPKDEAFTAGLFLEVGLLSLARDDLPRAAEIARMPAAHRPLVERAFGLLEHSRQGADIATTMRLPATVVEAIAGHHAAQRPAAPLAAVAWAAERVAAAWEGGDVARVTEEAHKAAVALGVPMTEVAELLAKIPEMVTAVAVTFQRSVDEQLDLERLADNARAQLVELNHGYEQIVRRLETLLAEKAQLADQLAHANDELAKLAATDALTRLPNRRAFDEALIRDLARNDRGVGGFSVILIDVDHFKSVNDTHGHPAGDAVLVTIADALRRTLRAGDIAARYGGEEFVVLANGSNLEGGRIAAERIRAEIERSVTVCAAGMIRVTASLGVAEMRDADRPRGEDLIKRADRALYAAKAAGRNTVC